MKRLAAAVVAGLVLAAASQRAFAASDLSGRVLFSGLAVPGATVTATRGDRVVSTVSDDDGAFRFGALEDGTWALRVEMRGFVAVGRDVALPLEGPPLTCTLTMRRYEEIVGSTPSPPPALVPVSGSVDESAADADVINGSVNNGAATPFAQARAFGNNRPRTGARYNGGATLTLGNSAWNARPYSFNASAAPAPSYADTQLGLMLGGPLRIPWLVKSGPQTFVGYQHGLVHNASTRSALMPTAAQRAGDFSASPNGIRDPLTGRPFTAGVIPADRISPQAAALLAYYPLPGGETASGANYQAPVLSAATQDNVQLSLSKSGTRSSFGGTLVFQRTVTDSVDLFNFADARRQSSLEAGVNWGRRVNLRTTLRGRYQFTRAVIDVTPFFANRTNVSREAGITGNSQDPANWGPPALSFPDVAGLSDVDYQRSVAATHAGGGEVLLKRGRHNITLGGDLRTTGVEVSSQPDPRGTLGFTGAATGLAFADFLLGLPSTSAIAFGDTTARLRGAAYDAYVTDDWRVSSLTLNLGVRWEYEAPFTGPAGRLASQLQPDERSVEPRLAASWRPVPASSLVLRASYGLYRNLGVYQPLALMLAQQPPFTRSLSVQNSAETPLALADPFPASLPSTRTFAVDPEYRPGGAHTWQLSAQRELPASLTVIAAYLGAKGTHLVQASLPNTYPAGAESPCPSCPSGFVYVTSNGRSLRNAGQFTLRRRLHHGLTASVQYTVAKSTDDAATFSNTAINPRSLTIAQDWLNPGAERGPSPFDQRHLVSAQIQYTTGVGVAGGTLVDSMWGTLLKDWTLAGQLTAGSGLPFTPVSFLAVAGTGYVGVRPRLTGLSTEPGSPDVYANPAAYAAPLPGTWGDAGRNSIRGPGQFGLDMSLARAFRLRGAVNLEWRVSAANVLNRVTFANIGTVIASPQFGRPTLANPMRRVQTVFRLRF